MTISRGEDWGVWVITGRYVNGWFSLVRLGLGAELSIGRKSPRRRPYVYLSATFLCAGISLTIGIPWVVEPVKRRTRRS